MSSHPLAAPRSLAPVSDLETFTWNACESAQDQKRIQIKEEALRVGFEQCEKLINKLQASFANISHLGEKGGSSIIGRENLEKWIENCKNLTKRRDAFEVPVGVAGPTGSGKTYALNAIIGFPELLPTSNQEAATAVLCKVAYNHDERPAFQFRAIVTFRTRKNLIKQLDKFFDDFRGRNELRDSGSNSPEDFEALRTANGALKPTLEMIKIVFGFEEREVETMTTQSLLASKQDIGKLLGTTKKLNHSKADEFSERIKPYMDSTTAQHTKSGMKFAAWPLIDQVQVFVRADILRNGVVLVDLPGLADSVESRAAVAEEYFPKLVATLIVSPARRAADDSTSVKLMSDHQELRMKMDGKFHKRSCCIVLSQIDQIDRKSALRTQGVKSNVELQRLLQEEKNLKAKLKGRQDEQKTARQKIKQLSKTIKAAKEEVKRYNKAAKGVTQDEKLAKAKSKRNRAAIIKEDHQATWKGLRGEVETLKRELKVLNGKITFICVQERNKFLEERIQNDFQGRQSLMTDDGQSGQLGNIYDGKVSVCPISAKAYWQCSNGEERLPGFPETQYSGIPLLANWIRNATIPERESQANGLLHDLHNLFNVIQTWSKEEWNHNRLQVSRKWIEDTIFPGVYNNLKERLDKHWDALNRDVNNKNPIRDKKISLEHCASECTGVVNSWSYKSPGDDASAEKLHWLTYQANVTRKGDKFVSRAGDTKIEYSWMEDISDVLLKTIVSDWNRSLNHDIPELAKPYSREIDIIWRDFLKRLEISVKETLSDLLPFLGEVIPKLDIIKEQIKDQIRQALRNISKDASQVHPDLVKAIQKKWEKVFKEAREAKGKGSFKNREKILQKFAENSSDKMFSAAFEKMCTQLSINFDKLPEALEGISKSTIRTVEENIGMLLNNILLPDDNLEDAVAGKLDLQQHIRQILLGWDLEWKVPEAAHTLDPSSENVEFPSEYVHVKTESDEENDAMDIDENEDDDSSDGDIDVDADVNADVDDDVDPDANSDADADIEVEDR
ncbi:hypothetical protein F4779DRAFT_642877 [Xylariaceae sp. FL0662B]|nr:hypothetical protein F4779DRAFT_642877 [Xylariaceae sp. FL0662B]